MGYGYFGWVIYQSMYVVILSFQLHQLRLKINAYRLQDESQVVQNLFGKNTTPILSHKDKMYMHVKKLGLIK